MRISRGEMIVTGRVRGTRSGFAFLILDDDGREDLFIAAAGLNGAIHGDRVRAVVVYRTPHDFRPEAQVEEILERPTPFFTGNVFRVARTWFVRPDSPLLPERLRLRLGPASAASGEKILFRVENRPDRERTPMAVYLECLGDEDDARLDPIVIASEFGLSPRHSDEALAEAEARAAAGQDAEDALREDFRGQFVLTIDPIDAKDFDDAIAIRRIDGGGYELTVHIADVSSYVLEGGTLDREAALRGTSVYFPGSVLPMLPDSLSSVAASLSPESDKRVLSAVMRFDSGGQRKSFRFARGWMRSRARLHYRQAQDILDGRETAEPELAGSLHAMAGLAGKLRARRFEEGGFDLDVPETEMSLGPDGVPVRVYRHETFESNRLIEEFMIAANRAAGEWALDRGVPFLFRVHGEPDPEALARFEDAVFTLMPGASPADLASIPRLRRWIGSIPRTPLGNVLRRFFLRSLKKALYAPIDIGHFGLGIHGYCHFTSPIRRYPDLFNHRRIKEMIDGRNSTARWDQAHALGLSSSRTEINAEEASREMIRLKAVRFMERHLGEVLEGHITGLANAGCFVELDELPIEGFIPRQELPPGVRFEPERLAWIEDRSGLEVRPGDAVKVQVARADLRARRIEFTLFKEEGRRGRSPKASQERELRDGGEEPRGRGGNRRALPAHGTRSEARPEGSAAEASAGQRARPGRSSGWPNGPSGRSQGDPPRRPGSSGRRRNPPGRRTGKGALRSSRSGAGGGRRKKKRR